MKVQNGIKKVGAVTGSLLMATLSLGAANLADFPQPYVDDSGAVASQIVVGNQAKAADVVGAVNIAATVGQQAVQVESETQTETATGAGGSFGWSAEGGVTLDTRNDDLFFSNNIDKVRSTLTGSDLTDLEDDEFRDGGSTTYDITQNLNVGSLSVDFSTNADEFESSDDPALHVDLPAENGVDTSNYAMNLQASMDTINVSDSDVAGEDIELFGRTYTIASGHDGGASHSYLKLFGSSEEVDVQTGETSTITVDGEDQTIEVVSVDAGNDQASVRANGDLRTENLNDEFDLNGQTVRVDEIVNVGANDDGDGIVQFAIGSEELRIPADGEIEDGDGDSIEGTYAQINGASAFDASNGADDEVSSIDIYLGAEDEDEDALTSGETFSHSLFENFELQFGGLNPDAADEGEDSGQIVVSNSGDDTATVELTDNDGNSATVEFAHENTGTVGDNQFSDNILADSDGDTISVREGSDNTGSQVHEDDYFVSDAGDFAHLWEVTSIDRDHTDGESGNYSDSDEAIVDLRDAVTGQQVEVDIPVQSNHDSGDTGTANYVGTEIIDGQTYYFEVDGTDPGEGVIVGWGDGTETITTSGDNGYILPGGIEPGNAGSSHSTFSGAAAGSVSLFTALDTESDASVAFTKAVDVSDVGDDVVFEFPSTESTGGSTSVHFTPGTNNIVEGGADETGNVNSNVDTNLSNGGTVSQDFRVGQLVYTVTSDGVNGDLGSIALDADQTLDDNGDSTAADVIEHPATVVIQPEDDANNEHAFVVTPGVDTGTDAEMSVGESGNFISTDSTTWSTDTLDSDDDVDEGYNIYGTHTVQDSDDQGDITLNVPFGQSVVGAAVTEDDGSLSTGGGGSVSVEYTTETVTSETLPNVARLDDDVTESVQADNHLILVGGPAVNTLVADLAADHDQVRTEDEWQGMTGEAQIQEVEDAFSQGHDALIVAGHSGEDTRAAAKYLSEYRENEQALADAGSSLTLTSAEYPADY